MVFVLIALILPSGKLYRGFLHTSLWIHDGLVTLSFVLVLTALLLITSLLTISARFSRLDMSLRALDGWFLFSLSYVGSRKLLR